MSGLARPLAGAALAGAATGARSFTGLAALTLGARRDATTQPDATLRRPGVKAAASALAAVECALDKLPGAPSRLAPPGLASRLAGAAASAVIIARRAGADHGGPAGFPDEGEAPAQADVPGPDGVPDAGPGPEPTGAAVRTAACVLVAVGAAAATAWAGTRWRAWASARLGSAWTAAGLEDAAACALAAAAVRAA